MDTKQMVMLPPYRPRTSLLRWLRELSPRDPEDVIRARDTFEAAHREATEARRLRALARKAGNNE